MERQLRNLVSFYPVSHDQTAVKRLLDYTKEQLEARGFTAMLHEYDGVHNLYASSRGQKHSRVLLQGHIDVVPGEQPFKVADGKYFGRGTYDMLYATAAFLRLADELQPVIGEYDLAIMLSGDEEKGGFNGVNRLLDEGGYSADVCLLPDAGEGFGSLNIAAKGVFGPTIRIHGRSHHGSRPWEGDGAAIKLARCLLEIEELFDTSSRDNSTLTVSRLQAGRAHNQGPATADASLDIRYENHADLERIQSGLERVLARYDGEITSVATGSNYQIGLNDPLVSTFVRLYEKHAGQPIRFTKAHGSSDARFFSEKGIPVIMLRPDGGGAHGDEEWISIASMEKFYALIKEFVTKEATGV